MPLLNDLDNLNICCVMVTYGERNEFVELCLEPLLSSRFIKHVILVDNASDCDYKRLTKEAKLELITNTENLGSSGGYSMGIAKAVALGAEYVLLLDDDNLVDVKELDKFIVSVLEDNIEIAAGVREDRAEFYSICHGNREYKGFIENSFLDYTIFSNEKNKELNYYKSRPLVYHYTYGGLFFKASLLEKTSGPNSSFFLYCDDFDFTYRLSNVSEGILLFKEFVIKDVDSSWIKKNNAGHQFLVSKDLQFRLYYSVRNRVYFERKELVTNLFYYFSNILILLVKLTLIMIFKSNSKKDCFLSLKTITRAIFDGFAGKLGKNESR